MLRIAVLAAAAIAALAGLGLHASASPRGSPLPVGSLGGVAIAAASVVALIVASILLRRLGLA